MKLLLAIALLVVSVNIYSDDAVFYNESIPIFNISSVENREIRPRVGSPLAVTAILKSQDLTIDDAWRFIEKNLAMPWNILNAASSLGITSK